MTGEDPLDRTRQSYEEAAAAYADRTSWDRSALTGARVVPGARVLELGSGPGRDADDLECAGLVVDRTDGAIAFVEMQRSRGRRARQLDMRSDDFGGPFDAVFANAVLLHAGRSELRSILAVARRATKTGGWLASTFKRGEGDAWSMQKLDAPRHFTYWLEEELASVVTSAGWSIDVLEESTSSGDAERWLTVLARNPEPEMIAE